MPTPKSTGGFAVLMYHPVARLVPETPEPEEELGVAADGITAGVHVVVNDSSSLLFSFETGALKMLVSLCRGGD